MFGDTFKKAGTRSLFISVAAAALILSFTVVASAFQFPGKKQEAPAAKTVNKQAAVTTDQKAAPVPAAAVKVQTPQPQAVQQKQPSAEEIEKRRNMIKTAKEKLNNTVIDIELSQMTSEPQKETFKDTIKFSDNKVGSDKLMSEGFPETNYTVSMSGENIVVWETMQTSEKKGLAFWKGELENGVMRGVLSRHIDEKTVKDYSFSSVKVEAVEPPKLEAAPKVAVPETEVAKPASPAASETKPEVKKEDPKKDAAAKKQAAAAKKDKSEKKKKGGLF